MPWIVLPGVRKLSESDTKSLDLKRTREETGCMKHLIFFCLIVLLIPIPGTRAQLQPFNQLNPDCCSNYQGGIISPSKVIDFKIIIIVPPRDLDRAMVVNPCPELKISPPKVSEPDAGKQVKQFFKLPPFPIRKPSEPSVHLWN
jgi:hypothetical protein